MHLVFKSNKVTTNISYIKKELKKEYYSLKLKKSSLLLDHCYKKCYKDQTWW
jgi:hypothetical protein